MISTQESAARMVAAAAAGIRDFYVMELRPGLVIDARNKVLFCGPGSHIQVCAWQRSCSRLHPPQAALQSIGMKGH